MYIKDVIMQRLLQSLVFIVAMVFSVKGKDITVIDAADGDPIISATVFCNSGVIKGLTGNDGKITVEVKEFPVVIQCIGYEQTIASSTDDTIKLRARAYELKEVETPADRPIKRVLCFAREYSSGLVGRDTMQYYCEYMAEAYISTGKVKGYRNYDAKPKIMTSKRYARIAKIGIDSVFRPKGDDDITELSWFDFLAFLPDERTEAPDAIKNGCETDTVKGKYGPKFIYRKKNGLFTMTCDYLSEHKDRKWSPLFFKLLGLTTDITMGSWTFSFADNGANTFGLPEFMSGTYNIHLTAKGKWMKKAFGTKDPIEMDSYLEIYPIEIINMTVNEYKKTRDEYQPLPFQYPDSIQPLSPAIRNLVERIDRGT